MKRYDIDWHLKFSGKLNKEVMERVTKILSMTEIISNEDSSRVYKIRRSLDICLPVILTKLDEFKISTYRDNENNVFVIEVFM